MKELIEQAITGDDLAYEQIVSPMLRDLYNIARAKLDNPDDVDDVIQETLLKLYKNLSKIRETKYLKTWAIRVLVNECNNIYRIKNRTVNLIDKIEKNTDVMEEYVDKIDDDFSNNSLLQDLTETERRITTLFYDKHYKLQEISKMLNMNYSTAKGYLFRSRKKIYKRSLASKQISKLAISIVCLTVLGSGVTFARRNTNACNEKITLYPVIATNALDYATKSGYNLDFNSEFVYSNNIGICIKDISMDNQLLNISYALDFNKDIKEVNLTEFTIKDENNDILATNVKSSISELLTSDYSNGNTAYSKTFNDNGVLTHTTLFQVQNGKQYPLSNNLKIHITKLYLTTANGENLELSGNWNLDINLQDQFLSRSFESYSFENNDKIKSMTAKLNDLSLVIDIEFNNKIDKTVLQRNDLILQDENGNIINCFSRTINTDRNSATYVCDAGKYSDNIDTLQLYVKYNNGTNNFIDITLNK